MAIKNKQISFVLALAAAGCLLLNMEDVSTYLPSATRHLESLGEEYGTLRDGTLLVPVGSAIGRSEGQNLLEKVKGTRKIMCDALYEDQRDNGNNRKFTRLHVQNDLCGDFSLGNMLPTLFSYHVIAHLADVPFTFSCLDSKPGVMELLQKEEEIPFPKSEFEKDYTLEDACVNKADNKFDDVAHGHHLIKHAMINEVAAKSEVEGADDAVIHVRLHDAFKKIRKDSQRGLFPHVAYSTMLQKAEMEKGPLETISIITDTFDEDKVRTNDQGYTELSRVVAEDLVLHLQEVFPNAQVFLRNDWEAETTVAAYTRLIQAKKIAVCGCSTFCPLPVVSVEDDVLAYLYDQEHLNQVFTKYFADTRENVHLWDAPMLGSNDIAKLSEDEILTFLRNDDTANINIDV